ncbi:hypothetical protein DPMN_068336 [Dreissena polymorpha]|uniref:Uncharacterized protein n=1 Tax=Dreissena polymorpha TaxID=45954 RepID=A0A9D3YZ13_DREPO|nr:hypothetical protein DPMN_068336 [Dreissena polymorpha]
MKSLIVNRQKDSQVEIHSYASFLTHMPLRQRSQPRGLNLNRHGYERSSGVAL